MSDTGLYIFDDDVARRWAPFSETRPIGEMMLGTTTLKARAERVLGFRCLGHLSSEGLAGFDEPGSPPVVESVDSHATSTRLFLSSRVALKGGAAVPLDRHARLTVDGTCVGRVVPPGAPAPDTVALRSPARHSDSLPDAPLEGEILEGPWHLVSRSPDWIRIDAQGWNPCAAPAGVTLVGDGLLSMAEGSSIEAGVVVDTRAGPVLLDERAVVEGPGRLVGPLYLGPSSIVFGGVVGGSTIGPACKIRGEVADSVFIGYANKAHDGHLGHAVVGRWANLGAGTTNSDLKNNYGPVRVWTPSGEVDTGLMKVGCFLGDHVKTAIGTMLNTGTVVRAGANLFGGHMPPKHVRAFSWGGQDGAPPFALDRFFEVAERAMARRGKELTPGVREVLARAWTAAQDR